jgi:hypothetical protein
MPYWYLFNKTIKYGNGALSVQAHRSIIVRPPATTARLRCAGPTGIFLYLKKSELLCIYEACAGKWGGMPPLWRFIAREFGFTVSTPLCCYDQTRTN